MSGIVIDLAKNWAVLSFEPALSGLKSKSKLVVVHIIDSVSTKKNTYLTNVILWWAG